MAQKPTIRSQFDKMKEEGYYVASTQMSFDINDKYYCLYSVGFSGLGKPEFMVRNVHRGLQNVVAGVFR